MPNYTAIANQDGTITWDYHPMPLTAEEVNTLHHMRYERQNALQENQRRNNTGLPHVPEPYDEVHDLHNILEENDLDDPATNRRRIRIANVIGDGRNVRNTPSLSLSDQIDGMSIEDGYPDHGNRPSWNAFHAEAGRRRRARQARDARNRHDSVVRNYGSR